MKNLVLLAGAIFTMSTANAQSVDVNINGDGTTVTINGVETHCSGNVSVINGQVSCSQNQPVLTLDRKSFCRKIVSDGMFGQPKGERKVCLSFKAGNVTDSSNTAFGNPPVTLPYQIKGDGLIIDGKDSYVISQDGTRLTDMETAVEFTLEPQI
jgi:hypothetical protein